MIFLQTTTTLEKIPSFNEIIKVYGPYLGLLLILIVGILILQYRWFIKILKAKDEEIKRSTGREEALNKRVLHMIDKEIGYRTDNVEN